MNGLKVKKGDKVKVITGKDAGHQGEILETFPAKGRVVVSGANIVHKALRPTQQNPNGGIDEREAPIDVSNVMLVCPHCGLPVRVNIKHDGKEKIRVCKKCGKDMD